MYVPSHPYQKQYPGQRIFIINVNGKQVPVASLSDSFTHDAVVIEADRATPHANVIAVLEEAREAGIANVTFKTQSETK